MVVSLQLVYLFVCSAAALAEHLPGNDGSPSLLDGQDDASGRHSHGEMAMLQLGFAPPSKTSSNQAILVQTSMVSDEQHNKSHNRSLLQTSVVSDEQLSKSQNRSNPVVLRQMQEQVLNFSVQSRSMMSHAMAMASALKAAHVAMANVSHEAVQQGSQKAMANASHEAVQQGSQKAMANASHEAVQQGSQKANATESADTRPSKGKTKKKQAPDTSQWQSIFFPVSIIFPILLLLLGNPLTTNTAVPPVEKEEKEEMGWLCKRGIHCYICQPCCTTVRGAVQGGKLRPDF